MYRWLKNYETAAYTLLRIVLALLYWSHGPRWLFGMFGGNAVPVLSMFGIAGIIETVCGALIAVGLFTSGAAFLASGEMAVAYFVAHVSRGGLIPILNGGEITVALCFGFLYIATRGAGPFSIDGLRGRSRSR